MFHRTGRSATFGLVCLALAGCTTNPEAQGVDEGIFLLSALGNTCVNEGETISFDFQIFIDADEDGEVDEDAEGNLINIVQTIPGATGLTDVIDVTDLDLGTDGSGDDLSGLWVGGDYFQLLPPGEYCVTATATGTTVPLLPSNPQTNCGIIVPEGGTAETVFTFQCEGQTISALDIVVLVQEGPSITGWEYTEDKFAMVCEDVGMTATFADLEGGPHIVTFEMFDQPIANYAGPGLNNGILVDSQTTTEAIPAGNVPHSVTWTPPSPSPAGTYYVYVSISDNGTPPLITTFQALLHSYNSAMDYCIDDTAEPISNTTQWTTQQPFAGELQFRFPDGSYPIKGARFVIDDATFTPGVGLGHFDILSPGMAGSVAVEGTVTLAYDHDGIDPLETRTYALDMNELSPTFTDIDGTQTTYMYGGNLAFKLLDPITGAEVGTGAYKGPKFVQDAGVYGGWKMDYGNGQWSLQGSGGAGLLFFSSFSSHPGQAVGYLTPENIVVYDNAWGLFTCDDEWVNLNEECANANLNLLPCSQVCDPAAP